LYKAVNELTLTPLCGLCGVLERLLGRLGRDFSTASHFSCTAGIILTVNTGKYGGRGRGGGGEEGTRLVPHTQSNCRGTGISYWRIHRCHFKEKN
jgi:hypothetical protein